MALVHIIFIQVADVSSMGIIHSLGVCIDNTFAYREALAYYVIIATKKGTR